MSEGGPVNDQAVLFPRLRYVRLSADISEVGEEWCYPYDCDCIRQVISVDELVEIPKRCEALGVPLECLEIDMKPGKRYPKYLGQLKSAAENTVIKVVGCDAQRSIVGKVLQKRAANWQGYG